MRVGFRAWMALVAIVVVALTVATMLLYAVPVTKQRLEAYDLDRLTARAAHTADAVSAGEGRDPTRAIALAASPEDREALLVDREGRVAERAGPEILGDGPQTGRMLRSASGGKRLFEQTHGLDVAVVPVLYGGELRGGVVLASRRSGGGALGLFLRSSFEAAALASVLGGGLVLLLATMLARRVERIASGARAIERGDLSRRIEPGFDDEHGELARAFNAMAERLQGSFSRLEERVAERTAELEAERARLEAVLRQMPSGVIVAEASSGRPVLRNEQVVRIWRRPLPPVEGVEDYGRVSRGFHPKDGRPYEPEEWPLARSVREGEVVRGEEIGILRGDGTRGTILMNSAPIRDCEGRVVAGVAVLEDVSARKEAEEALRESEEQYRAIFELAGVGNAQADPETGRFLRVNRRFSEITGYSEDELLGTTVPEITHPDSYEENLEGYRRVGRGEAEEYAVEKRYVRKDGSAVWVNVSAAPIRDGSGRVSSVVGAVQDVTARKEAEEALKESEERYRAIFEQAAVGMAEDAPDGTMLRVNKKLCEILGHGEEELLGRTFRDFTHPDDLEENAEQIRRLRSGEAAEFSMEKRYVKKDGSVVWGRVSASVVRGPSGEPKALVAVVEDVTERKRAEEEVRRLNEGLEERVRERTAELERERRTLDAVLDNLSEGVVAVDHDGRVVFANPAVGAMLGIVVGEGLPEALPDLWRDFDLPHAVARVSEGGEGIVARVGGARSPLMDVHVEPLPGLDGWRAGALVMMRDLSEGHRLEERQQRFLANAAHELKTPLTSLLGAAELLYEDDSDPDVRRRFLGRIVSEARRMRRLSETMLRLARTGTDLREPNPRPVALGAVARRAAGSMETLARRAGLAVSVEDGGGRALADEEWLEEALLILLSNAVKHSSRGGRVRVRAESSTASVEDEGEGISERDLPRIFERFHRGEGSSGGFGLGLPICKELVERMGGEISVESERGIGTTVRIRLPGARPTAPAPEDPRAGRPHGGGWWERFLAAQRRELEARGDGLLARVLGKASPDGELTAGLRRMAEEDRSKASEGLVPLLEGGVLRHKHVDDLVPEDLPARVEAEGAEVGRVLGHLKEAGEEGRPGERR